MHPVCSPLSTCFKGGGPRAATVHGGFLAGTLAACMLFVVMMSVCRDPQDSVLGHHASQAEPAQHSLSSRRASDSRPVTGIRNTPTGDFWPREQSKGHQGGIGNHVHSVTDQRMGLHPAKEGGILSPRAVRGWGQQGCHKPVYRFQ